MGYPAARSSFLVGPLAAAALTLLSFGCGSNASISSGFVPDGGDAAAGHHDATTLGNNEAGNLGNGDGSSGCAKPTCAELKATCGAVTDTKCGGVVQCGGCSGGKTCGGGGVHNQCGSGDDNNKDACARETCASQKLTCGVAGDGCGGMLECGSCNAPQACGGDPSKPGQCGCTGTCALVPTCTGGDAGVGTTLSGTVLDPAGANPIYNALVYIPNDPNDIGLKPFAAGVTCDVCGGTAAGDPLVSAHTAPDGTFTLANVPVGSTIPLVVQLGRWRRQFTINVGTPCAPNSIAAGTLTMPKNHTEGDIPRIGILTGGFDPLECVLRKIGVDDSEFTDPGGTGHIQFYTAAAPSAPPNPFGSSAAECPASPFGGGAKIDPATPTQSALFATTAGQPTLNQYDLVVLACEGYEEDETASWADLGAYTTAGGRVFMTDYAYDWLAQTKSCTTSGDCGIGGTCVGGKCTNAANVTENPAYSGVAAWHTAQDPNGSVQTCTVDEVSNPVGTAFDQWLQIVDVSAPGSDTVSIEPVFHNSDAVIPPTQQWLYWGSDTPLHYTFNAPIGAAGANQCGRLAFSDWHADTLGFSGTYASCPYDIGTDPPYYSNGLTFPAECDNGPMTAQEAILEFMLFDISTCVQPYVPLCTPRTCAAQSVDCGPAGDGCGNALECGTCASGQVCGGGGAGKCGTASSCTPVSCSSQHISCGPAGDGCGNEIQCGNCPTGQICGLGAPGQCGSAAPK